MTVELLCALIVIVLGLIQVMWQATEFRRVHGVDYANTAQDKPSDKPDSLLLGRLTRALRNLNETLAFFLGIVIILAFMGVSTATTQWAALIFAAARIIYLPLYASGIPYIRGLVWTVSFIALVTLTVVAVISADWSMLPI